MKDRKIQGAEVPDARTYNRLLAPQEPSYVRSYRLEET